MSDFVQLAQTFGLPLAMTLVAVLILSRVIVKVSGEKDKISDARYDDMKRQFEARLQEQREQYEERLEALTADRDWTRSRLAAGVGTVDTATTALEEMVRRVVRELPPPRNRDQR